MPWYTIRSHKREVSKQELPWSNMAEVRSASPIEAEQAQGAMAAWRLFERTLTFENIEFHAATCSSWVQEAKDEDPTDELFPYLGPVQLGLRSAAAAPSPLDDTLFINRLAARGNKGKLYLRGCIEENDLITTSRKRILKNVALFNFQSIIADASAQLFQNLSQFGLQLGMVSHPRIGWQVVEGPIGSRPKVRPIYDKTVVYERIVEELRAIGTTPLQLKQH